MVSNKLVTEIKTILHNLCVRGGEISRKTVIPIGNGVLSSRCPEISTKNVESVTITTKWARGILKSLDLVERCSTTTKRGRNPEWYEELTFIWKTKIVNAILEHSIYNEMILNFDQTPLCFTMSNKATFVEKDAQSVSSVNVDDKRQITGTFCVNISGEFLPVQLIYSGITDRCYPKVKFLSWFHITHSSNQWSNEPIVIDYLKKITFLYLEKKRRFETGGKCKAITDIWYLQRPNCKGCERVAPKELHPCYSCTIQTYFNLLIFSLIRVPSATFLLSSRYQDWYTEKLLEQLNRGVNAHDVNVDVRLKVH